jgi:formate dehydrogenase subunit gamma
MAFLLRYIRLIVAAWVLVSMAIHCNAFGRTAHQSTAESVKEEQLLKETKRIFGECTLPDRKACTLEQPRGRDWRYWYQVPLRLLGGLAILGMIAVVIGFYLIRGPVKIEHGRSGRIMIRFSAFERFVHWDGGRFASSFLRSRD